MKNELLITAMYDKGRADALDLQKRADSMTGTEINAQTDIIPVFYEAVKVMNMLDRKAGQKDGFICRSSAGRVVRLIQNYDSDIYTAEPEELDAQWRFVWSTDPAKALPFVALATSPFNTGDCCSENGDVYRSRIDNNVHAPSAYPAGWEKVE